MTDALEDHQGTVSIGGRTILLPTYLFADYIGGLAGKEEELDFLGIAWIRLLQPLAWKLVQRRPN